jgi:holo-[acyl-carrier protein] synthase
VTWWPTALVSPPDEPIRVRVGVDLVGVDRMERLVTENPDVQHVMFTDAELAYCTGKRRCYEHMAARFACKEATLKALGTGLGPRMRWTDVEVVRGHAGRPHVRLAGEVAAFAERRGMGAVDVSLSHTRDLAVAQAVAVWS